MASLQVSGAGVGAVAFAAKGKASIGALRLPSVVTVGEVRPSRRAFRGLVVRAATVVAPKYTILKPLVDRVLVKINSSEEKTTGGILLPTTAQSKPQGGEVVAVGEGRIIGDKKVDVSIQVGAQVVYSKYTGTEVELNDHNHLVLKEDDIIGILETDDVKDMKPLNDRVLIKVAEAEDKTPGGLLLTETTKEKPSIGTTRRRTWRTRIVSTVRRMEMTTLKVLLRSIAPRSLTVEGFVPMLKFGDLIFKLF
ncbi:20 kDa chaperonin, chloroplastic-like isoform X2 [Miscanthus floridulus]|uniref:20 kDa chaperonin, chloroplastic-like isoform X2 n=1 Tax=Miscanthus floridulus TaxID=154761 RepID=UPI003459C52B